MTRYPKAYDVVIALAAWAAVACIACLLVSCRPKNERFQGARTGVELRTERQVSNSKAIAKRHGDATTRLRTGQIIEDAHGINLDASLMSSGYEVEHQLRKDFQKDYEELRANRWVKAALFVRAAVWWAVASWVVIGVASIFLGQGNPLSWTSKLGRFFVRLMPAMNPFSQIRDWWQRKDGVEVVRTLKPVPTSKKVSTSPTAQSAGTQE